MSCYRVTFFKNLLSSDGHPFKCVQQVVDVRHARSADRAVEAAEPEELRDIRNILTHRAADTRRGALLGRLAP
jgi:hypothetical protein